MALRDLVDADCGGSNSLVRLTSHFTSDHALKDEGLRHPFTHGDNFGDSDQLVQQFLESTLGNSPQTFRMDSLLREMREMEAAVLAPGPVPSPGIAELAADPQCDPREWVDQYLGDGKSFTPGPAAGDIWSDAHADPNKEVSELGLGPIWAQEYIEATEHNQEELPPLAELSDLSTEWVESEEKAILDKSVDATEMLSTVSEPRTSHSKFMRFMRPSDELESTEADKDAEAWTKEFGETLPWEEQFQSRVSAIERPGPSTAAGPSSAAQETEKVPPPALEDVDNPFSNQFWDKLQASWSKVDQEQSWLSDFNDYTDPFKEYSFEKENPMADNADALEEGKKRLAEGDIPSAVLCFEAAAQGDPENALAWQLLGCTQAENEQDPMAIAALKKCLALEPENLTALMAIAVSFSNESYQNQACHALKEWLRVNPKYADLVPQNSNFKNMMGALSSIMPSGVHEDVKNLYIEAARRSPSESIDADVQCGLGVLFHLSDEFDKAVDCFKAALQVRPGDFRMWNRLGATLANGSRSEEAVDAYHHALQLFPGFIRARYNLGITCVNLGAHKEAAEHLLTALNQQAAGRGAHGERATTMSDSIWSTLKLVTALMERHDLYPAIDDRDLDRLNKEFNMD